jgi:hypothetical protein
LKQDAYKIKKVLENNKVTLKVGLLEDIECYIKKLHMGAHVHGTRVALARRLNGSIPYASTNTRSTATS